MAPPLDKSSPTPSGPARTFPGCDTERLREATARMNALGIPGEAVHTSSDSEEVRAYLESLLACDPTR